MNAEIAETDAALVLRAMRALGSLEARARADQGEGPERLGDSLRLVCSRLLATGAQS